MSNESVLLNCSERLARNELNVEALPLQQRFAPHILLQTIMPGTLLVVRIFMISWLTVGVFGNTLSFAIWVTKHQRRRSTSAIYLSALALVDLLLILLLINYHIERYWGISGVTQIKGLCHIYACLSIFSQYYSTILVFGFTVERYIAVCFPFKRHTLCSHRRALLAIVILMVICIIPTLFQAVLWTYESGQCIMKFELLQNPVIQWILTSQEIVFSLIVPLAALIFNILVLREMRRLIRSRSSPHRAISQSNSHDNAHFKFSLKKRKSSAYSSHSGYTDHHHQQQQQQQQQQSQQTSPEYGNQQNSQESSGFVATTIMLVILSFYLIACAVPPGVMYLAQFTWVQPDDCLTVEAIRKDPQWSVFIRQLQSKEFIDVMCASHYALNVFIYILTSKGFREHALWILTCNVDKLRRLSRPRMDSLIFPRRTGPKSVSHNSRNNTDETQTFMTDCNKFSTPNNHYDMFGENGK